MFQIVNNLISHQGKVLSSGDSDLAFSDKFADFFERKVARIRAELESVNTKTPAPPAQIAPCQLTEFGEITETELIKIIIIKGTNKIVLLGHITSMVSEGTPLSSEHWHPLLLIW